MEAINGKLRALVVSTACDEATSNEQIGAETYPYYDAYRALAPLLARWASTTVVTHPESRLHHALWQAGQQNRDALHLSFLPLRRTYLTPRAANLAFAYTEYPDLPLADWGGNPRNNVVEIARRLAVLLVPNTFSRQAFVRAGVQTPLHLVPVPVAAEYFALPRWQSGQRVVIDCPCYRFPQPEPPAGAGVDPWAPEGQAPSGLRGRLRRAYKDTVKRRLPASLEQNLCRARRLVALLRDKGKPLAISDPVSPSLELSGVVYTALFNPQEPRKNWHDLLSAFLRALGDEEQATLVLKLVAPPRQEAAAFHAFRGWYQHLKIRHRCQLAVVTAHLSDQQMRELAAASTYYVQASRAEGLGLPLQDFLAAGRPGISPVHTAMADFFDEEQGFVVAAHPEPTSWPHDPDGAHATTWQRLVWQSLHDQLRDSYRIARESPARYEALAESAQARLESWAGAANVWPRLAAALNAAPTAAPPSSELARAA